jgi:hypothetical protein
MTGFDLDGDRPFRASGRPRARLALCQAINRGPYLDSPFHRAGEPRPLAERGHRRLDGGGPSLKEGSNCKSNRVGVVHDGPGGWRLLCTLPAVETALGEFGEGAQLPERSVSAIDAPRLAA